MIEWIRVPAGELTMGLDTERFARLCHGRPRYVPAHRFVDTLPAHRRSVHDFDLQRAPLSEDRYESFAAEVRKAPHGALKWFKELIEVRGGHALQEIGRFTGPDGRFGPSVAQTPGAPVHGLSFFEAAACARFFAARLPTEAEWERAARFDDDRLLPCGDHVESGDVMNVRELGLGAPTPATRFAHATSKLGFVDLAGNVWEWTSDVYAAYPGGKTIDAATTGPPARVLRGGSYRDDTFAALAVARFPLDPWTRIAGLSVRLARDS